MTGTVDAMDFYKEQISETKTISMWELILGFTVSILLMIGSTWGLLYLLYAFNQVSIDLSRIIPYTTWMLIGSVGATVVAILVGIIILYYPRSISLPLKIHSFLKRQTGEYFLCPDMSDQSLSKIFRRALYGSVLVTGIALTIISFDMLVVVESADIMLFGIYVLIICTALLPFILMQFYYAPWLIKTAGLFHLDVRDRSLSNVGDDLEDILEFVAGVDIILVWLELTINTGGAAPWIPIFVILVPLGPLLSIVINFTLVFSIIQKRATNKVIGLLLNKYKVPDMVENSQYIRKRILALVDRRLLAEEAVELYESKIGSPIRGPDLLAAFSESDERRELKLPDLPGEEEVDGIIRHMRDSLDREMLETDVGVRRLQSSSSDEEDESSEYSE
ncbi:MAG: conserved membrane protein of unknown function [Candidatus Thorarchaeota archaeon]|nr:MAG: conserved membrane protein of unknown function [Candidatus Thorarchaeota archaeon]